MSNIQSENWDSIKDDALVENNAQTIFDHLNEIENLGKDNKRRWFWELLQNAKDSAGESNEVSVQVELLNDNLIFKHNGQDFNPSEIAHLIFHGSTKKENFYKTGKFGTGFMTTHLLSKEVEISGKLMNGQIFNFLLTRKGDSVSELHDSLDASWLGFQKSLNNHNLPKDGFGTYFKYILSEKGKEIAFDGLKDLQDIIPFVLAFNKNIKSIGIKENSNLIEFKKHDSTKQSAEYISLISIKSTNKLEPIKVFVAEKESIQLSFLGESFDKNLFLIKPIDANKPRLFLDFPFFGSENFKFSFLINSTAFKPRKERDGLYLGAESTKDNTTNKQELLKAFNLLVDFLNYGSQNKWGNLFRITFFGSPPNNSWHDKTWYDEEVKKTLDQILNIDFLTTYQAKNFISPNNILIPAGDDDDEIKSIYDLIKQIWPQKLISEESVFELQDYTNNWSNYFNKKKRELDFVIDLEKLCDKISAYNKLGNLNDEFKDENVTIQWLNNLIDILNKTSKTNLLNDYSIIPDQNGALQKASGNLRIDKDIDDNLKDIILKTEEDLRNTLVHKEILIPPDILATENQENVLNNIIPKTKSLSLNPNDYNNKEVIISLFIWLVKNKMESKLSNFPVFIRRTNEDNQEKLNELSKEKVLFTPIELGEQPFSSYYDIFSDEYIISSVYSSQLVQADIAFLKENGFLISNPIIKGSHTFERDDLEKILINENLEEVDKNLGDDIEHNLSETIVSKIKYLESPSDNSVLNSARKSNKRTRRLIEFLVNVVVNHDPLFTETTKVSCSCGSTHTIHPLFWLAKLKSNQWVNVGKDKSEGPSSINLSRYFPKNEQLYKTLNVEKVAKLMNMIGVSVGDLTRNIIAEDDDDLKFDWDRAVTKVLTGELSPEDVQNIFDDPELLNYLKETRKINQIIKRNQEIGETLERIFKQIFESPEYTSLGLKITREPYGRDFDIECDVQYEGKQNIYKVNSKSISFSIELKSTVGTIVRMTPYQGETASLNTDNYALGVYPNDGLKITTKKVKERMKFTLDIGAILKDKVAEVKALKAKTNETRKHGEDVEIEVNEGEIKYIIKDSLWGKGITFDEFVQFITTLKST